MTSMQKTYSPIDGSLLVERPYADAEHIALARQQAKQAQQRWQYPRGYGPRLGR